jgi:hypothetical protein
MFFVYRSMEHNIKTKRLILILTEKTTATLAVIVIFRIKQYSSLNTKRYGHRGNFYDASR